MENSEHPEHPEVSADSLLTCKVMVRNDSGFVARGAQFTDTLPESVEVFYATAAEGTCFVEPGKDNRLPQMTLFTE